MDKTRVPEDKICNTRQNTCKQAINQSSKSTDFVFPSVNTEVASKSFNENQEEIVYSTLPLNLNAEVVARATKSTPTGWKLSIKKINGLLSITHSDETLSQQREKDSPCIVCARKIGRKEIYLNFPDDLDRRRLWGNALGFKYNEILRLRMTAGYSITSLGRICTDHFTEECFRKFNFNKAAIEAFGMPVVFNTSNPGTPSKKRTPWDCTVCSYRCYSVCELHTHLSNHAKMGKEDHEVKNALFDKGISCPFCRRCTYGYKTISGFQRHLLIAPTSHFYLKRIYEIAVKNCRSSCLEPINQWSSWNENNVFYAYHGCNVPQKSPSKRLLSSPGASALEMKNKSENGNPSSKTIRRAARKLDLSDKGLLSSCTTAASQLEEDNAANIEMSSSYIARIKSVMPHDSTVDSQDDVIVGCPENLARALQLVTEEDVECEESLIFEEHEFTDLFTAHPEKCDKQRKTVRQIESNEARVRLFGDTDVPMGYKKVDGPDGPRLIPLEQKSWRERFAPHVQIRNPRFTCIN